MPSGNQKNRLGNSAIVNAQHMSEVPPSEPSYGLDEGRLTCDVSNVLICYLLSPMDAEKST